MAKAIEILDKKAKILNKDIKYVYYNAKNLIEKRNIDKEMNKHI